MGRVALIADDQEVSRIAFSTILSKKLGYDRIAEAAGLDEALEILANDADIDLALIDLIMPGMTTAASLTAVRECFPNVKVVVVSSSARRQDILLALSSGAHGYIIKDSGIAEIVKALELVEANVIFVPLVFAQPSAIGKDLLELDRTTRSVIGEMSPRQSDTLKLLSKAKSNKEIARILQISEGTVKLHVAAIFRILNVKNRALAAVVASKLLQES